MALKNLFGKGKKGASMVAPQRLETYFYHYNNGQYRAEVAYDPTYADGTFRGAFQDCRRVLLYVDPGFTEANGLPNAPWMGILNQCKTDLVSIIEKKGVACKLVGYSFYGGMLDLVFMVNGLAQFNKVVGTWQKKQKVYRVEETGSTGWNFYDEKLLPSAYLMQQVTDQQVIDGLIAAGTNAQAGHWTEHTILGSQFQLQQLVEKVKPEEFYQVQLEGDRLVLEKCLKLNIEEVFNGIEPLRVACTELGLSYDGWGAMVLSDRLVSGNINNGEGTYLWANGLWYSGPWKNGMRNGTGHMKFNEGSQYSGTFLDDKRTGEGTMTWTWNEFYQGEFLSGECHGSGTYYWPSGNRYSGQWHYGQRHGKGTFWWATGDIYEGDFINGKRTGKGKYHWTVGDWYEGDFVDGKLHGKGKEYITSRDELREGDYVNGDYKGGQIISQGGNAAPSQNQRQSPPPSNSGQESKPKAATQPKKKELRARDVSWKVTDPDQSELEAYIAKEARFAAARGFRTFIYYSPRNLPGHFDLRSHLIQPAVAQAFNRVHVLAMEEHQTDSLNVLGFSLSSSPCLLALNPNGSFAGQNLDGVFNSNDPAGLGATLASFFFPV